jgi:hypothetical protein
MDAHPHQDDVVLPGFYDHLYRGLSCNPNVGMAFCRFAISGANGHWTELGPLESELFCSAALAE